MASREIFSTRVAAIIIAIGLFVVSLAFPLVVFEQTAFDDTGFTVGEPGFLRWYQPTRIRSVDWDENTGHITVLVEYIGNETVTLNEVYVNETLDPEAAIVPRVLSPHQTAEITLSKSYFPEPLQIAIRIATSGERDAYFEKHFFGIQLERVDWEESTGKLRVNVKNIRDESVTLNEVYVNGTLDSAAIPNSVVLAADQTFEITLSGTNWDTHTDIPIKVTTLEGVSDEVSSPIYEIWIQSINWSGGKMSAYVYSEGYEREVNITGIYVNGTLDAEATIRGSLYPYLVTLSKTYVNNPAQLTLKVITADGAFDELTMRPNAYPNVQG